MRSKLLLSTAALLAGVAFASAQNMPSGGQSGGTAPKGATVGQSSQQSHEGRSGQAQEQGRQQQSQSQHSQGREQTTGQGAQPQHEQGMKGQAREQKSEQGKQTTGQGAQPQHEQGTKGQAREQKSEQGKQTTGQREQGKQDLGKQAQPQRGQEQGKQTTTGQGQQPTGAQRGQQPQTQGQAPQQHPQQGQTGQQPQPGQTGQQGQQPQMGQGQQPQTGQQGQQPQMGMQGQQGRGTVQLTNEQRTRIQQTVLSRSDVPRVDRVDFSLGVGTVVPTRVRVVEVPETLIEIYPAWRGHYYFVAGDDLVILDNGHRIIATAPVGGRSGALPSSGPSTAMGGGRATTTAGMSVEEIREVQMMLEHQGFAVEVDGRFGPKTREALISFQRQHGLQTTGEIDARTREALNVRGGGQPGSTGQGNMQHQGTQPNMQQGQGQSTQPQTPTTGQGGNNTSTQPQSSQQPMQHQPSPQGSSNPSNKPMTGQGGSQGGTGGSSGANNPSGGSK